MDKRTSVIFIEITGSIKEGGRVCACVD